MWSVQRSTAGEFVVFVLSGRFEAEHLAELQRLLDAEIQPLVLDLEQVELVDRETVKFLARCQAQGIQIEDCPAYIREWMVRERN